MKSVDQTLPNDAESLVKIVLSQRQALAEKEAKIDHQTDYIKQLIEAIQLAKHQHFGARSEKFNVDQLSLLFNEAELCKRKIKGVLLSPWLICETVIFMIGDHHADKTKNSETNLLAQTPHGSQCL